MHRLHANASAGQPGVPDDTSAFPSIVEYGAQRDSSDCGASFAPTGAGRGGSIIWVGIFEAARLARSLVGQIPAPREARAHRFSSKLVVLPR